MINPALLPPCLRPQQPPRTTFASAVTSTAATSSASLVRLSLAPAMPCSPVSLARLATSLTASPTLSLPAFRRATSVLNPDTSTRRPVLLSLSLSRSHSCESDFDVLLPSFSQRGPCPGLNTLANHGRPLSSSLLLFATFLTFFSSYRLHLPHRYRHRFGGHQGYRRRF
jgi:hypothetical protein